MTLPAAAPEQLIAEWRLKNQQEGTAQNAQLSRILDVLRVAERLRVMPGSPGESPVADVSVRLHFEDYHHVEELEASLQVAMALRKLVLGLPCLASLRKSAQDSLEHILHLLTDSVDLSAVNFDALAAAESLKLGGSLAALLQPTKAASRAKAAAKSLGPKRGDAKGWPFEATIALLVDSLSC